MRGSRYVAVLGVQFFGASFLAVAANADQPADPFIIAVKTFADNVLALGKDNYGPKHTPLFVDGLNIDTHEPVKWKLNGQEWILSDQASQQILFRTLDALSRITDDPKYKQAAVDAIRYQFANLRGSHGLLYWGGHCAYEAGTDTLVGEKHGGRFEHELKRHYPYYELMWEVDPEATKRYIEAFWGAHIIDWSNLCMNRHGRYDRDNATLWGNEYKGGPVFEPCEGLTFVSTGSDLYTAAAFLARFTGQKEPLVWAKRMAHRYVETRNEKTGLPGYQFTRYKSGDRAQKQFGAEWGERVLEGTLLVPEQSARQFADASVSELLLSELLGEDGKEFRQWGLDDLAAYAKYGYNEKDNTFSALITDGTRLTSADVKRKGYYGPEKSSEFDPRRVGGDLMRAYAMAYRISGEAKFWATTRSMARGTNLGDIGEKPAGQMHLNLNTGCGDANVILAILELYQKQHAPDYLKLARRIGSNIIKERFQKGLFVPCSDCVNAKFDTLDPLALLAVVAAERGQPSLVPTIWPGRSYFHCTYDGLGRTYDNHAIYSQQRHAAAPQNQHEQQEH